MIEIDKLITEAMKAKDQKSLRAYKNLKAEIQLVKTAKNAKPYDDTVENQVIMKYCKKLEAAIEEFKKADREDLVGDYQDELEVLSQYLPHIPTEEEISGVVVEWMKKNEGNKNFGLIMKHVKSTLPLADGSLASKVIKSLLV